MRVLTIRYENHRILTPFWSTNVLACLLICTQYWSSCTGGCHTRCSCLGNRRGGMDKANVDRNQQSSLITPTPTLKLSLFVRLIGGHAARPCGDLTRGVYLPYKCRVVWGLQGTCVKMAKSPPGSGCWVLSKVDVGCRRTVVMVVVSVVTASALEGYPGKAGGRASRVKLPN